MAWSGTIRVWALVAVALAGGARAEGTSPNDMFVGSLQRGTRAYRKVQGTVTMAMSLGPGATALGQHSLRLTFEGTPCPPGSTSCLALSGVVQGSATPRRSNPDTGALLRLHGHGLVSPLGQVVLRGTVRGTGFIETGHEVMVLTIASRRGTLWVDAESPSVPGFTSP
jgi:hypothetical protein